LNEFIALVPMKSHSVRVKNKNIKMINKKPLFYYILETLQKCKYVSKIFVNTDSDIIKEHIHKNFKNINIIDRPKHLTKKSISMNDIINYDINQINDSKYFLQTHSTNPLLTSKTIDRAIEIFTSNDKYDSLFSVTEMKKRFYDLNVNPINHDPKELLNTQDLVPLYEENSCVYLFTKKSFNINKNRIGKNPYMFEIDKSESTDIDDDFDFDLVKNIMCSVLE